MEVRLNPNKIMDLLGTVSYNKINFFLIRPIPAEISLWQLQIVSVYHAECKGCHLWQETTTKHIII